MKTSVQTTERTHKRIIEMSKSGLSIQTLAKKFQRKESTIKEIISDQKKNLRFFDWNTAGDPFINGRVNSY